MKYLALIGILTGLLQVSVAASGAEEFVLITSPPGYEANREVGQQLAHWKRSGVVSQLQLFESESKEQSSFQLFGIVSFSNAAQLQTWKQSHSSQLPKAVAVTEVNVLASLGHLSQAPTDSVFVIMEYDVMVNRTEFEDYIAGYQLPEMVVRESNGGLRAYRSYFARPDSVAPWQSLIIMEYRNESAWSDSAKVNKALGEQLALEDRRFSDFKKTKAGIRTKTAVTPARALLLDD